MGGRRPSKPEEIPNKKAPFIKKQFLYIDPCVSIKWQLKCDDMLEW